MAKRKRGVHEGVQGAGSPDRSREREGRGHGGTGTGPDGDGAAELGATGSDRRGPRSAGRAYDRGARGAQPPAARESDAAHGARHPKKATAFFAKENP